MKKFAQEKTQIAVYSTNKPITFVFGAFQEAILNSISHFNVLTQIK